MMASLGPHAWFIAASYIAAAVMVGGLIVWVVADHRAQRRALEALAAGGVRRRSAQSATTATQEPAE